MQFIPILSILKSNVFTKLLNNMIKVIKLSWVRVPLAAPNYECINKISNEQLHDFKRDSSKSLIYTIAMMYVFMTE